MEEMRFTVYGEPVGKGRPKFARAGNGVRTYTPEKTANYETLVGWCFQKDCGPERFSEGDQIEAEITAYYGIPKSASDKRKRLMRAGQLRPTKKPDIDNVIKSICDSLNGIAYKDDSQIVSCTAEKYYGDQPRVEVTLRKAKEVV